MNSINFIIINIYTCNRICFDAYSIAKSGSVEEKEDFYKKIALAATGSSVIFIGISLL